MITVLLVVVVLVGLTAVSYFLDFNSEVTAEQQTPELGWSDPFRKRSDGDG